jgi:hypothetical protein
MTGMTGAVADGKRAVSLVSYQAFACQVLADINPITSTGNLEDVVVHREGDASRSRHREVYLIQKGAAYV